MTGYEALALAARLNSLGVSPSVATDAAIKTMNRVNRKPTKSKNRRRMNKAA